METFVSVAVILGMIALGVFLIHRLNSQHENRIAAFHYGRSGMPLAGSALRKVRGRAGTSGTGRRRFSRRRPRKQA